MRTFELKREQWLPRPIAEIFTFFSAPSNLNRLTPPWLNFEFLTDGDIEMRQGLRLDYRIRLRGIPVRWQTEITAFEPPRRFVDVQRRGPYRLWIHEHTFEEDGGGTRVGDRVRYAVWGGSLARRLFVLRDLDRIFDFRHARLRELFGE